jgi:hypothetical protein
MKRLNVVDEAWGVVEDCLTLVEIKSEVQDLLSSRGSKRVCRCQSCRSGLKVTQEWLRDMRGLEAPEAA